MLRKVEAKREKAELHFSISILKLGIRVNKRRELQTPLHGLAGI